MSADQIAELAPVIREVFDAPDEQALCATFEVVGLSDAWVQVTSEEVNIAYPSNDDPASRLAAIVGAHPCSGASDWEPMKFATFSFTRDRPQVIAKFVDDLLCELFQLEDYSVDASIFEL